MPLWHAPGVLPFTGVRAAPGAAHGVAEVVCCSSRSQSIQRDISDPLRCGQQYPTLLIVYGPHETCESPALPASVMHHR